MTIRINFPRLTALIFVLGAAPLPAQLTPAETVLHSFGGQRGTNPAAGLTRDKSGNFYGTTSAGGTADLGVVFKLTGSGAETVLHNFTGADGATPDAGVVLDGEGNIYGTTYAGGPANLGVVYRLHAAGEVTVLHGFLGGADGANPDAGVVLDAEDNLYGVTLTGGIANQGTVYKIDPSGNETVLYSFTGGADGGLPVGNLLLDFSGNLYGATNSGGNSSGNLSYGVIFKIDPAGQETVLYSFTGGADGAWPHAGLTRDAAGSLYGTTLGGGLSGGGVCFALDTNGNETTLYDFQRLIEGTGPSGLVIDSAGNLYGTNQAGGTYGYGYVFELDRTSHKVSLYSFGGGTGGWRPEGGVVLDAAGNLYGTAEYGGGHQLFGGGIAYKLDSSLLNEKVLLSFADPTEGNVPAGGLAQDSAGDFFGTATYGGAHDQGVVFKVAADGAYSVLHTFTGGDAGGNPQYGATRDDQGNLYGTAGFGVPPGTEGAPAMIFKLAPTGEYTVLHTFSPSYVTPSSGLVRDGAGNFYGTTQSDARGCAGSVVYKLDPAGNYTVLYTFKGGDTACDPQGVIPDSAGNLYGTAAHDGSRGAGVVFKIDPAGEETVLYNFSNNGPNWPAPGMVRDAAGNLFGTTLYGGSSKYAGVLFKLNPSGQLYVLYDFPESQEVQVPLALTRDGAGNFYCPTMYGGVGSDGAVFKIGPTGGLLGEYSFSGGVGGFMGSSGVMVDASGNVYGETYSGGMGADGVVYKISFGDSMRAAASVDSAR